MKDRKFNLLIVDDEIMVIRAIMRVLDQSIFNIYYTIDPNKALDIIEKNLLDVIVSDQRMPNMTGLELLKRAKEIQPSAIRILMSGYSDIEIVIAAINEGRIYQYITKPWDNDKLISVIVNAATHRAEEDEKAEILIYNYEDMENWKRLTEQMSDQLHKKDEDTVNALLRVLRAKDVQLYKHSQRVSQTAEMLAEYMGLTQEQTEDTGCAGLFHDIGKIAIRDRIMYKPGSLDEDEMVEMRHHPTVSADIIREVDFLGRVADIAAQHHERIDGKGYPVGLRGEDILLEAQILSVADTFEALREDRVYKAGFSDSDALDIIVKDKGTRYSTQVVDSFVGLAGTGRLNKELYKLNA